MHFFGTCKNHEAVRSRHLAAASFLQVPKTCTHLELTLFLVLILGTCSKIVWKSKMPVLAVCFRNHVRALATCLQHEDHISITTDEWVRFHRNEFNEVLCKLDSTENPRSLEKYITLP